MLDAVSNLNTIAFCSAKFIVRSVLWFVALCRLALIIALYYTALSALLALVGIPTIWPDANHWPWWSLVQLLSLMQIDAEHFAYLFCMLVISPLEALYSDGAEWHDKLLNATVGHCIIYFVFGIGWFIQIFALFIYGKVLLTFVTFVMPRCQHIIPNKLVQPAKRFSSFLSALHDRITSVVFMPFKIILRFAIRTCIVRLVVQVVGVVRHVPMKLVHVCTFARQVCCLFRNFFYFPLFKGRNFSSDALRDTENFCSTASGIADQVPRLVRISFLLKWTAAIVIVVLVERFEVAEVGSMSFVYGPLMDSHALFSEALPPQVDQSVDYFTNGASLGNLPIVIYVAVSLNFYAYFHVDASGPGWTEDLFNNLLSIATNTVGIVCMSAIYFIVFFTLWRLTAWPVSRLSKHLCSLIPQAVQEFVPKYYRRCRNLHELWPFIALALAEALDTMATAAPRIFNNVVEELFQLSRRLALAWKRQLLDILHISMPYSTADRSRYVRTTLRSLAPPALA